MAFNYEPKVVTLTYMCSLWNLDSSFCSLPSSAPWQAHVLECLKLPGTCHLWHGGGSSGFFSPQRTLHSPERAVTVGVFLRIQATACLFYTCWHRKWMWKRVKQSAFLYQGTPLRFKTPLPWQNVVGVLVLQGSIRLIWLWTYIYAVLEETVVLWSFLGFPLYI